jgi:AhpC/TSA family
MSCLRRTDDSPVKTLIGAAAVLALGFLQPSAKAGDAAGWWAGLHAVDLHGAPLNPTARWYVVVFIGQECPVSNASVPVLNVLSAEFAPRGFAIVGAYVDPTASLSDLQAHAKDFAIGFATADDRSQRLAKVAGASYTPEAAVFTASGTLLYLGRIDDRVGESGAARPAAAHQDLRNVLAAIAAGSPGPFKGVAGYGCEIPQDVRK